MRFGSGIAGVVMAAVVLWQGSGAWAGEPSRDLVVLPLSAQHILIERNIPVTFKGSGFFLAEWTAREQAENKGLGLDFELLLRDVSDETSLFLFELHEGEEPPAAWTSRILYRHGLNVVLRAEDSEAQEWTLRGHHPVRLWHQPHGWGTRRTELVPFDCSAKPVVSEILGKTTQAQWLDWIEKLSGAEPVDIGGTLATIDTRFTSAMFSGAANARGFDFVRQQGQAWGFSGARIEEDPFSTGPAGKNLVLTIPGQTAPSQEVLLTGHLDSIWQSGSSTTSAPGANDNGTGSATLLEAARILRQYRFGRTIRIVFFTGEEQGLYGSAAYTQDHPMGGIQGVVNLDMFGYDANGDRCFEIHAGSLSQSQDVGNCFQASVASYSLGLTRDFLTSTATNRSDHASFWNVGVGAIEIAENYFSDNQVGGCVGSEPNPYYHTNNDTIAFNMHPPYAFSIAKAALATISAMALPIEACFASAPVVSANPGINQVDLSWAAVPGAASYSILRSAQGCGGAFVSVGQTAATTFVDTSVGATTYAYRVEAVAADGVCVSAESACVTASPTVYLANATSATYADSCSGGGPGSGNGVLEPGETVVMTVTLRNDGNATLTSLGGSLSSTTPGLAVLDPTAAWPDLAPGVSASTIPDHFSFRVDPGTACGTVLSLQLSTSSAEGAWNRTFTPLVGTPTTTQSTIPSTDVPKTINDNATAASTIIVSTTAAVQDVNVVLTIAHSYDADLDISLVGPNGMRVDLSSDNGGSGDNFTGTTFDDEAANPITSGAAPFSGSFRPEQALSILDGIPANGIWRLEVADDAIQDTGQLTSWSLVLTTAAAPVCNLCAGPASPGEAGAASPLLLSRAGTDVVMDWGVPPNPCSPATFAVYRGDLATLAAGAYDHDTQLACGVSTGTYRLAVDDVRLGDAAYFLVAADNGLAEGSYGRASTGGERPASAQACRAGQDLTSCP